LNVLIRQDQSAAGRAAGLIAMIEWIMQAFIIFAPDKVILWAASFLVVIIGTLVAMASLVLILQS
jgi:hypothetical protein